MLFIPIFLLTDDTTDAPFTSRAEYAYVLDVFNALFAPTFCAIVDIGTLS